MKPIRYIVAACFLFQGSALAQSWPEEVLANRKAEGAREERLGIYADSDEGGFLFGELLAKVGERGLTGEEWATAEFGPPQGFGRRERWLRDLLHDVGRLSQLSVEFRSFRFAPLEKPWVRGDLLERSADLENAAGDLFRSLTGDDPKAFEYDRAQFAARRLDEQLMMIGGLAARTRSDILQSLRADVVNVARQTRIASRLNILWELGRSLEVPP